jgi:hypothetical protein
MGKNRASRGFGAAVVVKGQSEPKSKSITEEAALERLSKESLESLRGGKITDSSPSAPESVKVVNEEADEKGDGVADGVTSDNGSTESILLTQDQITAIAQMAAIAATAPFEERISSLQTELETSRAAQQEQIESMEAERQDALNRLQALSSVFKLTGNPEPITPREAESNGMPSINLLISGKSDKPEGALKEFMSIKSSIRVLGNSECASTATPEHNRFLKQNLEALTADLETYGKANGLFRGRSAGSASVADINAVTQISDLPGGFLETLSAIVRTTHRPSFIFWQFANNRFDFTAGNGDTIDIPRAAYASAPADPDDRLLSGGGTYADIVSTSDSIQTGIVKAVVQEWGRGKPGSGASPLAVSRFTESFSMLEVIQFIVRNLMHDYELWEDLKCRRMWTPTSRVVYNNNNTVVTSPGAVTAGNARGCTRAFLTEMFGYARSLLIPTYQDGCYGLALTTKAATQLKQSLDERFWFGTPPDMERLVNILNLAEMGEAGKVTGYLGKIENFHIFESNNFSVGAAGTEGVRNETLGGGSALTRTNFMFGADTFGRGIAEPPQIVKDEVRNFGRRDRLTWLTWQGFAAMDIDPVGYNDTSAVPQQLRVLDVRFTDAVI